MTMLPIVHVFGRLAVAVFAAATVGANVQSMDTVKVTRDNFVRAESDMYMAQRVKAAGLGKLQHIREPMPIDHQSVIRANRDTLYSSGVFDLDAGPVTVTMPDARGRFMSLASISEDHYASDAMYGKGTYIFSRDKVGTRYVLLAVRTLVDPNKPMDVAQVHTLQDQIKVAQARTGRFEIPNWDQVSQTVVRKQLLTIGEAMPDTRHMFGQRGQVDPQRHLIGTAMAWGGNPERDALYLTRMPAQNDGKTVHRLTVKEVPVDGFWSISVYNADGYFQKNQYDSYSLNNITAVTGSDGAVSVQFGGCDGKIANCLPITTRWNYAVRLYRPRLEVLNGAWTFPEAKPVPLTARMAP